MVYALVDTFNNEPVSTRFIGAEKALRVNNRLKGTRFPLEWQEVFSSDEMPAAKYDPPHRAIFNA